jgi:carboxypeptidase T
MASHTRPRFSLPRSLLAALAIGAVALPLAARPAVAATTATPARPVPAAASPAVSVQRFGTLDRFDAAAAISRSLLPAGNAPVVYLASGDAWSDELVAGVVAARTGGVVLLTKGTGLPSVVAAELVRLAPARVVVLGSTAVIGAAVYAQVRAIIPAAATMQRIYGSDGYVTAATLSASAFPAGSGGTMLIATGNICSDALAAAPAAAALHMPLLITASASLPPATAAEIKRIRPAHVIVVGSTAYVQAAVANAIHALGPTVERISGADRNAVAAAVAARFFPGSTDAVATPGSSCAEALIAGPLAGARSAPILYTGPDDVPVPSRDALIARHPTSIAIVGTQSEVTEIVRGELIGWSDGELAVPAAGPTYAAADSMYHDYGEMATMIHGAQIARPDLVQAFSIGKSYEGRDIWAAKISDNVTVDEDEPEVLIDALHHSDERLGVEQALYLLEQLVNDYSSDLVVRSLVNTREIYIVFALNPDGWAYDLGSSTYRLWRKNRQPNPNSGYVGTDINRNYSYMWGCCNGSSSNKGAWNYRGAAPFSTPEASALRDFVASRVVNGVQQIKTHVTLHANGELILYPYAYTKTDIPADMTVDDHDTFVAMAAAMASMNGYKAEQSSDLYITDGDEIDWLYHDYHVFSFTFEVYPTDQTTQRRNMYPPDEVIAAQTARNRTALFYLIQAAGCPYDAIGKAAQYCGGKQPPGPIWGGM